MNSGYRIWLSPPHLAEGSAAAIAECLQSGWVAPAGPYLDAFEAGLCGLSGRSHALATASGAAAIHLALAVLGVGPGDVVLCSSLTFVAAVNPIRYLGATPVLVGSEPESWNLCPEALATALTALERTGTRPKALLITQLYGRCAQMEALLGLAERYGVPVVEDAAEAVGARWQGQPAGSFGRLSVYSFNGNKLITTGGGGALLTDDPTLAARARKLAAQAREPALHYEHTELGYTYRMSSVLAALGTAQLGAVPAYAERRRAHYAAYQGRLGLLPGVAFLPQRPGAYDTCWLTTLTLDPARSGGITRAEVSAALQAAGIESRPVWKPMHLQPLYHPAPYYGDGTAQAAFEHGLCLPSGSNLTPEAFEEVCGCVEGCFR